MQTQLNFPAYVEDKHLNMIPVQEATGFDAAAHRLVQEQLANTLAAKPDFAGLDVSEGATLVGFRAPHAPGKAGTEVAGLVQVALYFVEVAPFRPIPKEALQERMAFAVETGYLVMGRDECLAVLHTTPEEHTFCEVYECNTDGVPRSLAGYYADNVIERAKLCRISNLHITATREAKARTLGNIHWWGPMKHTFNKVQMERQLRTLKLLAEHEEVAPAERLPSGAVIERSFIEGGTTQSVVQLRPREAGWVNYPTSQDAWYYGVWVNPKTHELLTFAEQDVMHIKCNHGMQFREELHNLAKFHGSRRQPGAWSYSSQGSTAFFDNLFLLSGQSHYVKFRRKGQPDVAKDADGNWIPPLFGALMLEHPDVLALGKEAFSLLPLEAFELDRLDPLAFEPYQVTARLSDVGYDINLVTARGDVFEASANLQAKNTSDEAGLGDFLGPVELGLSESNSASSN